MPKNLAVITNLNFSSKIKGCLGSCGIEPGDESHPNRLPFSATLVLLDQPSDMPPHGAESHRIYVPTEVAQKRLGTLIGMGVNYDDELDGHNPKHKVGVITGAKIVGKQLKIFGTIWKKDFPEAVKDLRTKDMGASMELADCYIEDRDADVWKLQDFHFTGAALLHRYDAAYHDTQLRAEGNKQFVQLIAAAADAARVYANMLGAIDIIAKGIEIGMKNGMRKKRRTTCGCKNHGGK